MACVGAGVAPACVGAGVGDGAVVGMGGGGAVGIVVGKAIGVKATVGLAAGAGVGATSASNAQADKTITMKLHHPSLRNHVIVGLSSEQGLVELACEFYTLRV